MPDVRHCDGVAMNARTVANVREQLARIAHLSPAALLPEVRTLVAALPADERERLRTVALVVIRATAGAPGDIR
jgi:hypothetical protein